METKIIKAVFGGGSYAVTNKRTRTDYGQVLEFVGIDLPETFECIFSNSATSAGVGKKQIGSAQRVLIPDEYLATGQAIYAWVLVHDGENDGRHMYSVKIPVADMPDTSPEEPTPVEQSVISQAIAALNTAVDTTTQKAQEASDSADRAEQAADGTEGYAERAEAAQSAAESARDEAVTAEASARTSAATATEKASEAISSAATASQSALTAESASESASASASASAESASQASQSADTASGKASEASGYASSANTSAQTASKKALEASQSATNAQTYASNAESAKTDAQTAKTQAESARDGAITAKTSAESARDTTQNIVDGISGKVEQIDSNTERIESLEDDRYKPYPTDTASGSIASFPDGADNIPLKSCIVRVEPVQEGSGDPSPGNVRPISGWTGCEVNRAGENLFPYKDVESQTKNGVTFTVEKSNGVITNIHMQGTATTQFSFPFHENVGVEPWVLPEGNFLLYIGGDKPTQIKTFDLNVRKFGTTSDIIATFGTTKITLSEQTAFGSAYIWVYSGAVLNHNIIPVIVQSGVNTSVKYPLTQRQSISIDLGQTVYGATVDVINGELVVDRAQIASYNGETLPSTWISDRDVYSAGTTPTIGAQVVYKLAEPIHYQLTPQEITSLLGQNNLLANTGDTEVEYRADTTLYINKKIAEALASLT